jgi:hypothetical protein
MSLKTSPRLHIEPCFGTTHFEFNPTPLVEPACSWLSQLQLDTDLDGPVRRYAKKQCGILRIVWCLNPSEMPENQHTLPTALCRWQHWVQRESKQMFAAQTWREDLSPIEKPGCGRQ